MNLKGSSSWKNSSRLGRKTRAGPMPREVRQSDLPLLNLPHFSGRWSG